MTQDAGHLPAWGKSELPAPPPMSPRNVLRMIGPGIIAMGMAIGAGEWLFGPVATVEYRGRLMWVVATVIVLQAVLNTECIRYTLYTGEPIFTGYMRLAPGPKFWGPLFVLLDLCTSFWPGFAMTAATALAAAIIGQDRLPGSEDKRMIQVIATLIFLGLGTLLLFGGKVYNAIEKAMTIMVVLLLGYLVLVAVFMVDLGTWALFARGLVGFEVLPEIASSGNFLVVGAFIAYAGLGGLGNATISSYARDKGFGMGAVVGAVPALIGGRTLSLSHTGKIFEPNEQNLDRWRGWWRYVAIDQWIVWALGSFVGMALPGVIALQFLSPGETVSEWGAAATQARGLARVGGDVFWPLTLLCGFFVLLSTQLGAIEILPRRWTDLAWSGSAAVRKLGPGWVGRIYYSTIGVYVAWCLIIVWADLKSPFFLVVLMANLGLFPIIVTFILTPIVNRRFLPAALRPPLWRELTLILGACLYALFFVMTTVLDERGVLRILAKEVFS